MLVAIPGGKDISLDGSVDLKNFAWRKDDKSIDGFNGRIPFSEHLLSVGGKLRFSELVAENPFERANFERLRPLLQGEEQISIQNIHWQEKTFGPLIGFFSIRQNMMILHELSLSLGTGSLDGEMFFNAYPKNLEFGMLSRITGLDLGQVLPAVFLSRIPDGSKTVSARTGFVFSFNKAALDGRIDITEIGSAQMLTLINVLDPRFEDDKMNKLRQVLEVGYPTGVAMAFNQGYLDMDIDLKALGIPERESIHSIPLSGFLMKPAAEIVSMSQKGPLE
jgi:hypothetical protein